MKLIIKERGSGKTTGIIRASSMTGYPIVTQNGFMVSEIQRKAQEMGYNIPKPITVDELLRKKKKGESTYEKVLFDEIYQTLGKAINAYLGCEVVAATMTDVYTERLEY